MKVAEKSKVGKTIEEVVAKKLKEANEILTKGNFAAIYEAQKHR